MDLKTEVQKIIQGQVLDDEQTLTTFSKDASIFAIKPKLVVSPLNTQDISSLVNLINKNPKSKITLTPRAAGTCMSGGSLTESIVLDMTKHFNKVIEITESTAITQPGVFYRDFEKETLKKNLLLPCYTSSRELNTVGGMVGNNSAGEKTLSYGQTERYVKNLKMVFSDGNEYIVTPLTKTELDKKIAQKDFEGKLYKNIWDLIQDNQKIISQSPPDTSKNSTGYNLWKVWDGKIFDLTKLITGSQGTLGIVTEIEFNLVHPKPISYTIVLTLHDLKQLDKLINQVLTHNPESFECYDDQTLKAASSYLADLVKDFKNSNGISSYIKLIPEFLMKVRKQFPPLVLLAEFTGDTDKEVLEKCHQTVKTLSEFKIQAQILKTKDAEKYWIIRRQSFNLLRLHTQGKRTAPFIDDIIVNPIHLEEFLPKLDEILKPYEGKLTYTLAGHIGNGNFHIIPLMDFSDKSSVELIPEVSEKVFDLVFSFKGSMAAEHNDGLVRGPYLEKMYGEQVYQLFKEVKEIFDPNNIFNPNKKVDATFEYSLGHINTEGKETFPLDYINKK